MKNNNSWLKTKLSILLIILCSTVNLSFGKAESTSINSPTILQVVEQTLIVNGRKSHVFNIIQPNGFVGYSGTKGKFFNVIVENKTSVPTVIHWHGLIVPNPEDGVPYVTQLPIPPGGSYHYHFKLIQAGTFWMHSHYQLQEQQLMAAPLIIKDPNDPYKNAKNVIMLLQDFTFTNPEQLFLNLRKKLPMDSGSDLKVNNSMIHTPKMSKMLAGTLPATMKSAANSQDLNDVNYDAMLTNRHTLENPEIINVTPGQTVRLRIINAASGSEFWLYTGTLTGTAIAMDGEPIKPYKNKKFQIAIGQRMDILVTIPNRGGVFPILAQSQGMRMQTGLILRTPNTKVPAISALAAKIAPPLNDDQEFQIKALHPLTNKPIDNTLTYTLDGNMMQYIWAINGQVWPKVTPLMIKKGQWIAMVFINKTGMAHPMHFHGHVFETTNINGTPIKDGALHDTIYVLPHSKVTVVFDANNPGIWMMHCHVLFHQAAGMQTTINYAGYPESTMYKNLLAGKDNP